MQYIFLDSNFGLFLGRFHPLMVHLPIGFLFLAILFHFLGKRTQFQFLKQALPFSLFLAAISAFAATVLGLLLANNGSYEWSTLNWHRWSGIALTVSSITAWWLASKAPQLKDKPYLDWVLWTQIPILLITGHFGGSLTHGSDYLTAYGPFSSSSNTTNSDLDLPNSPDSILIYAHIIEPVLEEKCFSCHNDQKQQGNLNMSDHERLLTGGDGGKVLVKGAPMESELLRRVTLSPDSRKFMPPKGMPLTYQEIRLIDYWISNGLSFELSITDSLSSDIQTLIEQHFGISQQWKSYVEKQAIDPVSPKLLSTIKTAGFSVSPISESINFLEVKYNGEIKPPQIKNLLKIKSHISWLNLSNTELTDQNLTTVSKLENLTKLRIDGNSIGDQGLENISKLSNLEVLNLYNTQITDEGLALIAQFPKLKQVSIWKTNVSKAAVERLMQKRPSLEVNYDFDLIESVRQDSLNQAL